MRREKLAWVMHSTYPIKDPPSRKGPGLRISHFIIPKKVYQHQQLHLVSGQQCHDILDSTNEPQSVRITVYQLLLLQQVVHGLPR